jgi:D-glycero-alpha-D-manno-heptose-7-phosphate kinase
MIIRSRSPVRIEFGGGGTDLPKYFEEETGYVLNATINKYVYGTLKPKHTNDLRVLASDFKSSKLFSDIRREGKFEGDIQLIKDIIAHLSVNYGVDIFLRSDIPPNTGLGSAATVAVSVIGLFNHLKYEKSMDRFDIAELAYKINNIGNEIPGGKQCQYASTFGGLNMLEFRPDGNTRVHPLNIKRSTLLELEKHLILAYVGKRESLEGVKQIITNQQLSYNDEQKTNKLHELKELAIDMKQALVRNDLITFGENLGKAWEIKKLLNPSITNPKLDDIYNMATKFGALGGRIIGAGGGGHMLFYCDSNKEQQVSSRLQEAGIGIIDFSFTDKGLETWEANQ